MFYSKIHSSITTLIEDRSDRALLYQNSAEGSSNYSLGYNLVVSQPSPIRLLLGLGYMHVFPLPLWQGLSSELGDYHWIKSYQGVFLVCLFPLGFLGLLRGIKLTISGGAHVPQVAFLSLYSIFTLLIVISTTLETRHHGQFLPSFLILAALPNLNNREHRKQYRLIAYFWFLAVAFTHVLWMIIKGTM